MFSKISICEATEIMYKELGCEILSKSKMYIVQGVLSQSVQDESVLTERRGLKKNYFVIDL